MSNYKLDITGTLRLDDYALIKDYFYILDNRDDLIIHISNNPEREINILCDILNKDNFDIIKKGELRNGQYFIKAKKE